MFNDVPITDYFEAAVQYEGIDEVLVDVTFTPELIISDSQMDQIMAFIRAAGVRLQDEIAAFLELPEVVNV